MSQSSNETIFLGVTQPMSTAHPDNIDIRRSQQLSECLASFNIVESPEQLQERIDVLRKVNSLVRDWIKSETKDSTENGEEIVGKLFTFGSYRLGVHNRGADIDSLCVAPRHVDRRQFFTTFYDLLKADPEVSDLLAIEEAFVPLIKLRYRSIELDILFARLPLETIPDDISLCDDYLLRNLDDKSIRSLNGFRVADEILKAVPNQENFGVVLRAIKLWAKNHGIYSNVLGFFGGISWSILVARICQLYPNAAPSKLLYKFFYFFSQWEWPNPVLLKDSDLDLQQDLPALQQMVWNPRTRFYDRQHLMPIITPAFPEQNSTPNVTVSGKSILVREMKAGYDLCDRIYRGKAPWNKLFEEFHFFSRYEHFIGLVCAARTEEDLLVYSGFVESKLRFFVGLLERNADVALAHINPKQFKPIPGAPVDIDYEWILSSFSSDPVMTMWFIGLEIDVKHPKDIDLGDEIQHFVTTLQEAQNIGDKYNDFMTVKPHYVPRQNLELFLAKVFLRSTTDCSTETAKTSSSENFTSKENGETEKNSVEVEKMENREENGLQDSTKENKVETEASGCAEGKDVAAEKTLKRKVDDEGAPIGFDAKRPILSTSSIA